MSAGDVPVAGTTGLAHTASAVVEEAAKWLAMTRRHERPGPVIFELRRRFDLTAREACEAAKLAAIIRGRAT